MLRLFHPKDQGIGLSSFGNKILGKDTSKKPLPVGASTGTTSTVSSLPGGDLDKKTQEEKPVAAESPEIKTPSKSSTSLPPPLHPQNPRRRLPPSTS